MSVVLETAIEKILEYLEDEVTFLGIGTGNAPAITDTLLNAETERKIATRLIDDNILVVESFWDTNEGNGVTYTNAGVFGDDATADLNTGKLFFGGEINVEKTETETLTVSFEITVERVWHNALQ